MIDSDVYLFEKETEELFKRDKELDELLDKNWHCCHFNSDLPYESCMLTQKCCLLRPKLNPTECVYYKIYEEAYQQGYSEGKLGEDL